MACYGCRTLKRKNSWDSWGGITRRAAVILLKKKKTSQILLRSLVKENKKVKKNEKTIEVKNHENPLINYIYDIYNKKNNTLYNILIIYMNRNSTLLTHPHTTLYYIYDVIPFFSH